MDDNSQPYHAHIYYVPETRGVAEQDRQELGDRMASGQIPQLLFIGKMKDYKAGPHPTPQFEIHYTKAALPAIVSFLESTGLTALVHPLTDDDLADHSTLAHWIGEPLEHFRAAAVLRPRRDDQGAQRGLPGEIGIRIRRGINGRPAWRRRSRQAAGPLFRAPFPSLSYA